MRNWILVANQAGNLIKQENFSEMKDFLVDIGSNRRLAAGMLLAKFKTPWNFLAEMPAQARASGAGAVNSDANQIWWSWPGSNRRPSDCEPDALPTELQPRLYVGARAPTQNAGAPMPPHPALGLAKPEPRFIYLGDTISSTPIYQSDSCIYHDQSRSNNLTIFSAD